MYSGLVPYRIVLEFGGAASSGMRLSIHAARSICRSSGLAGSVRQPSILRIVIWPDALRKGFGLAPQVHAIVAKYPALKEAVYPVIGNDWLTPAIASDLGLPVSP